MPDLFWDFKRNHLATIYVAPQSQENPTSRHIQSRSELDRFLPIRISPANEHGNRKRKPNPVSSFDLNQAFTQINTTQK